MGFLLGAYGKLMAGKRTTPGPYDERSITIETRYS